MQITSLWARTPVDQDYDHSSPTAQGQQLITLDFFSLLEELLEKESSCFLLNHFPHKTVLQNFSPPLKFPFLFQLQKTGTCLLTSVSCSFQVQLPSSNHLQSPTLNAKLVLVKAETRNNLFYFAPCLHNIWSIRV